jgi:deazaflavin-dependent oxidoreductase (nitroreductase family)
MDAKLYNEEVIREFRANKGKVGQLEGFPLLLLTTTGARSGQPHLTPLIPVWDGGHLIVIASAAGAPRNPAWFHNLIAHPEVAVETGDGAFRAVAVVADDTERERLWGLVTDAYPEVKDYQSKTSRRIPVVVLERVGV